MDCTLALILGVGVLLALAALGAPRRLIPQTTTEQLIHELRRRSPRAQKHNPNHRTFLRHSRWPRADGRTQNRTDP